MILSVSRRTDIPNYYADWFMNRLREGYLYVKNPMNDHQVSRINLSPDTLDCIVFWTKNPVGIMRYLDELSSYMYYFQFTITPYDNKVEQNLPDKESVIIPRFIELSERIGKERVIWRYDPIILSKEYNEQYHIDAFSRMAMRLQGYTDKCVISLVDLYGKNRRFLDGTDGAGSAQRFTELAGKLSGIGRQYGITLASCSEHIDLTKAGIEHNSCVDKKLIEQLLGCKLDVRKDKNQRAECGCVESIDIGSYNTCRNGCRYCYATFDNNALERKCASYDQASPILCGHITSEDKITVRKVESLRNWQLSLDL